MHTPGIMAHSKKRLPRLKAILAGSVHRSTYCMKCFLNNLDNIITASRFLDIA